MAQPLSFMAASYNRNDEKEAKRLTWKNVDVNPNMSIYNPFFLMNRLHGFMLSFGNESSSAKA